MPTRSELSDDLPDSFQQAASAVWAVIGGHDEVNRIIGEAFVSYYKGYQVMVGGRSVQMTPDTRDEVELFERFQVRVWLRVIDLMLEGGE